MQDLKSIEKALGLKFNNVSLLEEALTHSSAANELGVPNLNFKHNERLEFLGDAVLDLVVGGILFDARPKDDEGVLSTLKSQIVNGETLAICAKRLGLSEMIHFGKGELKNFGNSKTSNLSSAFEALVGALYVDKGFDEARTFAEKWLSVEIETNLTKGVQIDPKTRLQMILQNLDGTVPTYQIKSRSGPDHSPFFTCVVISNGLSIATGAGSTKATAERQAAESAIQYISARYS